jgi:ABC-type transport system involved in Fe-S cluster assembly fused permease/ATPase subunit
MKVRDEDVASEVLSVISYGHTVSALARGPFRAKNISHTFGNIYSTNIEQYVYVFTLTLCVITYVLCTVTMSTSKMHLRGKTQAKAHNFLPTRLTNDNLKINIETMNNFNKNKHLIKPNSKKEHKVITTNKLETITI